MAEGRTEKNTRIRAMLGLSPASRGRCYIRVYDMPIHPTAIVHSSAQIGENVDIQAYAIIGENAVIGDETVIGPHCIIGPSAVLGKRNHCFSGAQIGIPPQDLKHIPGAAGRTVIGDGNIFREFVTVSCSTVYQPGETGKVTSIGDACLFMACTHVAHDCVIGDGVIMANGAVLAGHVTIQDRAILGGLVGIHQFCVIGAMSFIGGMTRVNKDTLPYMIIEGIPARCFGPNTIGLERNGLSKARHQAHPEDVSPALPLGPEYHPRSRTH